MRSREGTLTYNPDTPTETTQFVRVLELPKSKFKDFTIMHKDTLMKYVLEQDFAASDLKVLFYMGMMMGYDNVCEQSVTQIAESLALSRRITSQCVSRLAAAELIAPARSSGRTTFYMVSPYIFSRCKASQLEKVIARWEVMFNQQPPNLSVVEPKAKQPRKQGKAKKIKDDHGSAIA